MPRRFRPGTLACDWRVATIVAVREGICGPPFEACDEQAAGISEILSTAHAPAAAGRRIRAAPHLLVGGEVVPRLHGVAVVGAQQPLPVFDQRLAYRDGLHCAVAQLVEVMRQPPVSQDRIIKGSPRFVMQESVGLEV